MVWIHLQLQHQVRGIKRQTRSDDSTPSVRPAVQVGLKWTELTAPSRQREIARQFMLANQTKLVNVNPKVWSELHGVPMRLHLPECG